MVREAAAPACGGRVAARLEAKLGLAVFDGVAAAILARVRRRIFAGAPAAGLRCLPWGTGLPRRAICYVITSMTCCAPAPLPSFLPSPRCRCCSALGAAGAQTAVSPGSAAAAVELPEATLPELVVQARRAEAARQGILARFGAREYQVERGTIEALPGGANQPLNQVLLQTPGVVQDSFGDIHVRGEHRNLQYRINGVQLPEGLQGFGQVFDSRSLRSVSVLTGALPAQFGFRTNAVISLETRTGALDPGGSVGLYGGSFGTLQPHASYAGVVGGWDLFATGTFLRSDRGVENPTPARTVPNNETEQLRGLLYAARQLDATTRLSVVAGTALNRFEIPAPGGVRSAFGDDGSSRARGSAAGNGSGPGTGRWRSRRR